MDITALTNNPIVKTLLTKQLKKAMTESNVQLIAITLDDSGELAFEVFDTAPVSIIETTELNELKDTIKTLLL